MIDIVIINNSINLGAIHNYVKVLRGTGGLKNLYMTLLLGKGEKAIFNILQVEICVLQCRVGNLNAKR